jgi:hypothetical protein
MDLVVMLLAHQMTQTIIQGNQLPGRSKHLFLSFCPEQKMVGFFCKMYLFACFSWVTLEFSVETVQH